MKTCNRNPTVKEKKIALSSKAGQKNMVPDDILFTIKKSIMSLQIACAIIGRSCTIYIAKAAIRAEKHVGRV